MGAAFWIRRFILVWTAAFVLIAGAQALKGHYLAYAPGRSPLHARLSSAASSSSSPGERSAALVAATTTGQTDLGATA